MRAVDYAGACQRVTAAVVRFFRRETKIKCKCVIHVKRRLNRPPPCVDEYGNFQAASTDKAQFPGEQRCVINVEDDQGGRHRTISIDTDHGEELVKESFNPDGQLPPRLAVFFTEPEKWLYGGTQGERIPLHHDCTLEKAVVLCLLMYDIKDWSYPLAHSKALLLKQQVVVNDDVHKA
ncbi:uncharacterized protein LOC135384597 [Ornithodoros turicata]|uniref:uncharacterized protein LOC135384597 n=1 Tax=Ornithodoros turicata TaxID=34597 RepID=UPI003139FC3C